MISSAFANFKSPASRSACHRLLCSLGVCVLGYALPSLQAQVVITREFAVNQDIPDGGELANAQNLSVGAVSIADVNVTLRVSGRGEGGFNGDLYATLRHETGFAILLNRPGKLNQSGFGYGDSGLNVTLDDTAAQGDIHLYRHALSANHSTALSGALTGAWSPDGRAVDPALVQSTDPRTSLLSSFQNLSASGEWLLFVADLSSGGLNKLDSWGLQIRTNPSIDGSLTLANDTLQADGGARTLSNPVTLAGDVTFSGSEPLTFTGSTTLTSARTLTVDNTTTFSGTINDAGGGYGFTKQGSGTLVLEGNHTYSGPTTVSAGTLDVRGNISSSSVTASGGGRVTGNGVLGPLTVATGGTLSPGASPGSITAGSTVWESGGNYLWEINDVNAGAGANPGWDLINVNGSLTVAATAANPFTIRITSLSLANTAGPVHDFNAAQSYTWRLVTTTGGVSEFSASKFNLNATDFLNSLDGGSFLISQNGGFIELSYAPVPEPAHTAFCACVLSLTAAMIRFLKRRRK